MTPRSTVKMFALLAGLSLIAPAASATLAVYPPAAQLESASDLQRLIVVKTRPDGVTQDVTAEVAITFAPEGIASWDPAGKLKSVADGEAQATVTWNGEQVVVPVKVTNAAVVPPASFRNDVLPVLMRTGCNSGACHGSASGKNGFGLTLFGYDPDKDFISLTRDMAGRRMNVALPTESLMLMKPSGQVDHEGGSKFTVGDPFYERIQRWIAEGAVNDPAELPQLTGIEILPHEAVLEGEGATQNFVVRATYTDGSDKDVTDLAILAASDEASLTVDGAGKATAGAKGEVYVMARYGSFAVVSQAIILQKDTQLAWPEDAQPKNYIDEFVFAKLKKLRIPPASLANDSVFLRRVYLDVLGVLPSVEETKAFMADAAPDKRAKLIDTLLQRPEFNELWAMKWADVLRVGIIPNLLDVKAMHRYNDWLRGAMTKNVPMDQVVRELLSAEGGNFTNPAANFYIVEPDPTLLAENVAQVFMGVQIKCAQCHNHPFERWTMEDYYSFAAFFGQVGRKASSDPREQIIYDRQSGEVNNLKNGQPMKPKFLGGEVPDTTGKDRREVLANWLTSPENPWFSKNIANRVWGHFFGAGIVSPEDDVRVTNPPVNPQLLDELGKKMIEYKYDLRNLVRDICNSYTYQMSTQARDPSVTDQRNLAFAKVRRMSAEQMLDAISTVTESKVKFPNLPLGARAAQVADGNSGVYFLSVFGRPPRTTVCACERTAEPTLAQSLHLVNGDTVNNAIKSPGGKLEKLLASEKPTPEVVQELYLAALSRTPTEEEVKKIDEYVTGAADRKLALEDTLWSILNSKEFIFNH